MMADRGQRCDVGSVVPARPLSLPAPPFIVSSPSHRVSRGARPGPAEDLEVVGDGAQPDPALHAGRSTVPTPAQPVTPLEGTDASLAAGAPAQGRAGGAGPRRAGVPRQHDVPHAPSPGRQSARSATPRSHTW